MAMPDFFQNFSCEMLINDKTFDSDGVLKRLAERGSDAVIPPKKNRNVQQAFDRDTHRERHRVENFFAIIEEFRAIVMLVQQNRA